MTYSMLLADKLKGALILNHAILYLARQPHPPNPDWDEVTMPLEILEKLRDELSHG